MVNTAVEMRDVVKKFPNPGGVEVTAVDHINLQIQNGEFFSLLGPSGCGKTTSLRMVAGFEWPNEGEIFINSEPMGHKPPFLRAVNTVFQNYALFEHMTVYQNVAFGLEMEKVPRAQIDHRVREALGMVQLEGMGKRKPKQLSGGQQQRVALARALIKRPAVLLLDEPLGALDLKLRKEMQLELKSLQEQVGITFIYVTHDQDEALTMSDRIAVMNRGKVLQVGKPVEIYERPNSRFVADFIGETNFLPGQVIEFTEEGVLVKLNQSEHTITGLPQGELQPRQEVVVSVRPEKVRLINDPSSGIGINHHEKNVYPVKVLHKSYSGSDTRFIVDFGKGVQLKIWEQNKISLVEQHAYYSHGDQIWISIYPDNALVIAEN